MFRFTIRDVLWLTVVVGLAVAWGLDHWRQEAEVTHQAAKAKQWELSFQETDISGVQR